MIVIKRDNYERFFLDYLDGNLTKSEVDHLMSFLNNNPDLKEELNELENEILISEKYIFNKKTVLKKEPILTSELDNNFDELCIASIEGDLNEFQLAEFNKLVDENSNLKKQLILLEKTVLVPDLKITYNNKSSLRKSLFVSKQKVRYRYLSLAASFALLITLSLFIPKSIHDNKNYSQLSSINNEIIVPAANENNLAVQETKKEVPINRLFKTNKNTYGQENNITNLPNKEKIIEVREGFLPLASSPIPIAEDGKTIADLKIIYPIISINQPALKTTYSEPRSIKNILVQTFNRKVLKKESDLNTINTYDFADLAISGVNKITGTNMSLNKKYDNKGNVTELEFNSRLIAFSTPIKR